MRPSIEKKCIYNAHRKVHCLSIYFFKIPNLPDQWVTVRSNKDNNYALIVCPKLLFLSHLDDFSKMNTKYVHFLFYQLNTLIFLLNSTPSSAFDVFLNLLLKWYHKNIYFIENLVIQKFSLIYIYESHSYKLITCISLLFLCLFLNKIIWRKTIFFKISYQTWISR